MTRSTIHAALFGALILTAAPFAVMAQETKTEAQNDNKGNNKGENKADSKVEAGAAASTDAAPFTAEQKKALDTAFREFLMANPKVIMDSVEQFRQNQESAEMQAFTQKIKERHEEIYNDPASPVAGNPKGEVTLVEFFDYNCGYCKHAFKDVQTLIGEDKNLRVVFKEIPILSESSHTAARYALASHKQGKYWEFHTALMNSTGQINESKLESVAKDVGLDLKKLKEDAADPAIRAAIEKNLALAHDIGISGTPGFVLGDEALRGHYGLDTLRRFIKDQHSRKAAE